MPVFGYYNTDLFESQYPFFKPSLFVFPKKREKNLLCGGKIFHYPLAKTTKTLYNIANGVLCREKKPKG